MTNEERALAFVEMRLAGVHPDWALWFAYHPVAGYRANVDFVIKEVQRNASSWYGRQPTGNDVPDLARKYRRSIQHD